MLEARTRLALIVGGTCVLFLLGPRLFGDSEPQDLYERQLYLVLDSVSHDASEKALTIDYTLWNDSEIPLEFDPRSLDWAIKTGIRFWPVDSQLVYRVGPPSVIGQLAPPPPPVRLSPAAKHVGTVTIRYEDTGFAVNDPFARPPSWDKRVARLPAGKYALDFSQGFYIRAGDSRQELRVVLSSRNKNWLSVRTANP